MSTQSWRTRIEMQCFVQYELLHWEHRGWGEGSWSRSAGFACLETGVDLPPRYLSQAQLVIWEQLSLSPSLLSLIWVSG